MNAVLTMEGVSKTFRGNPVLRNVDMELSEGECLAVTGPNGSGKSVLFRLACRIATPDSGRVTIDSQYLARRATFPQGFGVIIDRPGYVGSRTGLDNLKDLAAIRGLVDEASLRDAMVRVGLDPETPQIVARYSLGMKQKLALAQSFMEGQRVLILDEPFNALDERSVTVVRELLAEFLAEGRTILFTSHNRDDVSALATRHLQISELKLKAAPLPS